MLSEFICFFVGRLRAADLHFTELGWRPTLSDEIVHKMSAGGVIVGSILLYSRPEESRTWGLVVLIISAVNFLFGMGGVLAGGLNQATVETLEPAKVWIVDRDTLLLLMDEHPPLARIITVDECADVAVFLGSDMSSAITGHVIPVDGGNNLCRLPRWSPPRRRKSETTSPE